MPGLTGIVSPSATFRPTEVIPGIRRLLSLPGAPLTISEYADERCAVVNSATGLLHGGQCEPAVKGDHLLFLEGEIFDIAGQPVLGEKDVAARLLDRFLTSPSGFAHGLNGEFNVCIYQRDAARLTIVCDHLSSRPMFYYLQGDTLWFGSEKKAILSALPQSVKVDELGLLQLFAHEHNIGDRTFIKGLKRLPPGSVLTFEGGKLRISSWHSLVFGEDRRMSFEDAVEHAAKRLKDAAQKRTAEGRRIVLTLSGGLDSRAVAAALPRDLRPLPSVTQSVSGGSECTIGEQVAQRLRLDHYRISPRRMVLSDLLPLVAWRSEGETSLRNTLGVHYHDLMKSHGDFIAGGWLAECTSGQILAPFMLMPAASEKFIERCFSHKLRYPWSVLGQVFTSEFLTRNRDALRQAFLESWAPLEGGSNVDRYHAWYLRHRAIRMTNASMPVDSHLFEKIRPFYDRDYLETAASFPWRFRLGQTFYKALIYRLAPELRDLPESGSGRPVYDNRVRNGLVSAADLWAWTRKKLAHAPSSVGTAYSTPADVSLDPGWLIRSCSELRWGVERFLSGPICDDSVFNVAGIRGLMRDHYERGIEHSELIMCLATVHKALEQLVYSRPAAAPAFGLDTPRRASSF